ncbi:Reverse transcriptase zinc-binding domain [Sesbania bispinosa]|nr:Reverse transcriptase zinc-binding domain [Sesbania bispinosa]
MLKLAWKIISSPDSPWVKVLKDRYQIPSCSIPSVTAKVRSSPLWKNIVKIWNHIHQCSCWILGKGDKIRSWMDNFIPLVGPLQNLSQGNIPSWQVDLPAAAFVTNGVWNWSMFSDFISADGLAALASTKPPEENADPDCLAWKFSSSGEFSLKSAFNHLMGLSDSNYIADHVFKKIWSWQGPPRITSFIWKLYHGRLLTNSERMKRGMASNDICPRCGEHSEDIMHAIRDCEDTLWESLIDHNQWAIFFSMGLSQWVKKNILDYAFSSAGTPWNFVFPVAA